jgi:multicomponent Na+:H+ antiporter subunit B
MIGRAVTVLVLLCVAVLFGYLATAGTPTQLGGVSRHYVERGLIENRGSNIVTSVVVNYRGLDTLGEVTVLFLSVTGVAFVLRRRRAAAVGHSDAGGTPMDSTGVRDRSVRSSELVRTGARLLVGPMILFGAYIFVHGHLTPGGGFQGGAVVASAVLLLLLADRERELPHGLMSWLESLSGFGFVLVGLIGLAVAGSFLANSGVMPLGTWNRLFSGGVIPIIYVLIGLKVGSELAALLDVMMRGEEGGAG